MRSRLGVSLSVAAGALLAAAALPAASAAARHAAATAPPAWRVVPVPSSVVLPATLNDVSAAGLATAWAVGAEKETGVQRGTPLILRWNGRAWSKVALRGVPGPGSLNSVSAQSRSDAWALGKGKSGTVLLHWNGLRWRTVGFPGRATATMSSVAAAPHGIAWLVGSRKNAAGASKILVERWNGVAWHIVATGLGLGRLNKVRASADGDVWAAGADANFFPLIAHEHRGVWTSFPGPSPDVTTVNDLLARSAHDVWAVGFLSNPRAFAPTISHWNGSTWTTIFVPSGVISQNLSISPDRSGQPQWTGADSGLNPSVTLYAHFDGTMWSNVQGATPLSGVNVAFTVTSHIPGTNATWAVGGSAVFASQGTMPVSAIIEFNRGTPPA